VTITLQQSGNVSGPYQNTAAKYISTNSTLTTTATGGTTGFYRTAGYQSGVSLGQPKVTGSNVVMQVQVP
jgi:hypothetical protein